jgi:hypothetical protein
MGQLVGRSQKFADDVVQVARLSAAHSVLWSYARHQGTSPSGWLIGAGKTLQRLLPLDALRIVLRGADKEDKAAA